MGIISLSWLQISVWSYGTCTNWLCPIRIDTRKHWPCIHSINSCTNCRCCQLPLVWIKLNVDTFYLIELIQLSIPIPYCRLRNSAGSHVSHFESIGWQTHTDLRSRNVTRVDRLNISQRHVLLVQLRCTWRMELHSGLSRLSPLIAIFLRHS